VFPLTVRTRLTITAIDLHMVELPERKVIAIYGASSPHVDQVFKDQAFELGALLAGNGRRIVTGAGSTGLMAAVEDGALSLGGHVTGIIPQFMIDNGWLHEGLSQVIATKDMHERKATMAAMADACIALPGGTGTFEELFEVITWKMLGLFAKPIVILNTDSYYAPMLEMLDRTVERKFMNSRFLSLWAVADTPARALELLDGMPDMDCGRSKID